MVELQFPLVASDGFVRPSNPVAPKIEPGSDVDVLPLREKAPSDDFEACVCSERLTVNTSPTEWARRSPTKNPGCAAE